MTDKKTVLEYKRPEIGTLAYKTQNSVGFDFICTESVVIPPRGWGLVSTGCFIIENPGIIEEDENYTYLFELQIRPRSSLIKRGLIVANSPGTVDLDYPEEIKICLYNTTDLGVIVPIGDRVAQGVFALAVRPKCIPVEDTVRSSGFGSTGV